MLSAIVASIHFLALGMSIWSVLERGRNFALLKQNVTDTKIRNLVLFYDNFWGVSALLIIATGLARAFLGLEKGTTYYLSNPIFHAKLGLVMLILLVEMFPMVQLIKWRIAIARKKEIVLNTERIGVYATISFVQLVCLALIIILASLMAHGIGV